MTSRNARRAAERACLRALPLAAMLFASGMPAFSQIADAPVRHVASCGPVTGSRRELATERVAVSGHPAPPVSVGRPGNRWTLEATLPNVVIKDIAFPTEDVGYLVAELGQVWKTADGGRSWTQIMDLRFPYYWEGVVAFNANDVVVSGFNDMTTAGVLCWTHDGGETWEPMISLGPGPAYRVRFANARDGLVMQSASHVDPNIAHYTTDGGLSGPDWTQTIPDPDGAWFGNQFSLLDNLHARTSGITFCSSLNGGVTWACNGRSIDAIFDGPVFFYDDNTGWVGGGEIMPNVQGWVHRTTNGGETWSDRTLNAPWPIREMRFISPQTGWAAGGDVYSGVGGIFYTADGGRTWSLDLDSRGHEMDACDSRSVPGGYRIWCAGYDSSLTGVIYSLDTAGRRHK